MKIKISKTRKQKYRGRFGTALLSIYCFVVIHILFKANSYYWVHIASLLGRYNATNFKAPSIYAIFILAIIVSLIIWYITNDAKNKKVIYMKIKKSSNQDPQIERSQPWLSRSENIEIAMIAAALNGIVFITIVLTAQFFLLEWAEFDGATAIFPIAFGSIISFSTFFNVNYSDFLNLKEITPDVKCSLELEHRSIWEMIRNLIIVCIAGFTGFVLTYNLRWIYALPEAVIQSEHYGPNLLLFSLLLLSLIAGIFIGVICPLLRRLEDIELFLREKR